MDPLDFKIALPELQKRPLVIETKEAILEFRGAEFANQGSYFARGLFYCTEIDSPNNTCYSKKYIGSFE